MQKSNSIANGPGLVFSFINPSIYTLSRGYDHTKTISIISTNS